MKKERRTRQKSWYVGRGERVGGETKAKRGCKITESPTSFAQLLKFFVAGVADCLECAPRSCERKTERDGK